MTYILDETADYASAALTNPRISRKAKELILNGSDTDAAIKEMMDFLTEKDNMIPVAVYMDTAAELIIESVSAELDLPF